MIIVVVVIASGGTVCTIALGISLLGADIKGSSTTLCGTVGLCWFCSSSIRPDKRRIGRGGRVVGSRPSFIEQFEDTLLLIFRCSTSSSGSRKGVTLSTSIIIIAIITTRIVIVVVLCNVGRTRRGTKGYFQRFVLRGNECRICFALSYLGQRRWFSVPIATITTTIITII